MALLTHQIGPARVIGHCRGCGQPGRLTVCVFAQDDGPPVRLPNEGKVALCGGCVLRAEAGWVPALPPPPPNPVLGVVAVTVLAGLAAALLLRGVT